MKLGKIRQAVAKPSQKLQDILFTPPEHLIQIEAYKRYQTRNQAAGSSETDWQAAKKYLKKHPIIVFTWRLKNWGRNVLKILWRSLTFPCWLIGKLFQWGRNVLKILWRSLIFPLWKLPTLFANASSRDFAF